jgi:hypothetical protein
LRGWAKIAKEELGISGGFSAQEGCPSAYVTGSGLKIWVSWKLCHGHGTPALQGAATVRLARRMYRIPYPAKATQGELFP